jgi:hypothetical protein
VRRYLHWAFVGFALFAAVPHARAQGTGAGWLSDRNRLQGPGFRVGRLELHPGIATEIGYDSNLFYESKNPNGNGIFRLSGHTDVSTLGAQRRSEGETEAEPRQEHRAVQFRGGVGASYYKFLAARARDNVEVDVYADAVINPDGRFSVRLGDQYARTIRPFTDAPPPGTPIPSYVRNNETFDATLSMGSRSGLLQGVIGYQLGLESFKDAGFQYFDSLTHRIQARASWRFLPQTAIVQNNEVTIQQFYRASDAPVALVSGNRRIRSTIGLNGAITQRIFVTLSGGYSVGFYDAADEFESFNAQVEARFRATERTMLTLGYFRRFNPSFIGNFVRSDRIYAEFRYLIDGRIMVRADAYLSFDETGRAFLADATTPLGTQPRRHDLRYRISTSAEYRFAHWVGIIANLSYQQSVTDFEYVSTVPGGLPDPGAGYKVFQAWLGLRVSY